MGKLKPVALTAAVFAVASLAAMLLSEDFQRAVVFGMVAITAAILSRTE